MTGQKKNIVSPAGAWFKEAFFTRRMQSLPGLIVMALVGIGLAYAGHQLGDKVPIIIVGAVAGIFFLVVCFRNPELSFYAYIYSTIIFTLPARLFGLWVPLGTLVEITGYLAALSIMAAQYRKRENSAGFWKTPISLMMLLIFFYMLLQAFNPEIDNLEGWFNLFRRQIVYLLFYYVCFLMLDSLEKIERFVKMWIALALIVALWGIKQQFFGFNSYEDAYVHSDPNVTSLLFQGGMFRKFSILSDPATFGILSTSTALFTLVLAIRMPIKKVRRWLYFFSLLQVVASSYSGTRTCNLMLVGGLASYIVFTLNERRTIIVLISSVFVSVFLLFGPFRFSPVISRIRTTFEASKDASNIVRDVNRKNIQPYIYEHPIGGGLQTSGEEGNKFYPYHRLAGYPPDSGYLKIALEQGWVGLAITVVFYFFILLRGITGFFDSRKTKIKTLYIAFTVCFFSLAVGQYSQQAIYAYPQYPFFLATLVIFYKLKEYDKRIPEDHDRVLA